MKPEDLITYCGGFCGTCARCSQYTAFREAASVLAELTEGHGFHHWMPGAVKEFGYTEFQKGLVFFCKSRFVACLQECLQRWQRWASLLRSQLLRAAQSGYLF